MLTRRILVLLIFVGFIVLMGLVLRSSPRLTWIVDHEEAFREYVSANPISSWCCGLLVYFVVSLVPGTAGKSVVCGWLFGFWGALAMVELGLTGAALVSFLSGRYFFRRLVHQRWQARLNNLQRRFVRDGAYYLLTLRMAHAPFTLVNYGTGATNVPLVVFSWTTLLGILPGTIVFTLVGARIPSLKLLVEQGLWSLVDLPLCFALIVTASLPWLTRRLVRGPARGGQHPC